MNKIGSITVIEPITVNGLGHVLPGTVLHFPDDVTAATANFNILIGKAQLNEIEAPEVDEN